MPVGVSWLVCGKGTVREAMVTIVHLSIHLPVKARLQTRSAGSRRCAVVLLHSEEVRRQAEAVPRVLMKSRRGDDVLLRPGL